MDSRGPPDEDVLLQSPWLPVSISGHQLLSKSWFGEASYRILLTDMYCVWEEKMDATAIQTRAQELNRRLRANVDAFFSHLCEVVQPCLTGHRGSHQDQVQISLTRQEGDRIHMRLKSELAGLPFYWEFHCTPAPVTLVCSQLLRPLLAMSRLLQEQVDQLSGLLVQKDAEIQDYRENGATLSRERLQTDTFEEQTYKEDFMTKTLPRLDDEKQDARGFNADLQQLYAAIITHRKPSEEKEEEVEEEQAPITASPISIEPADRKRKADTPGAKMADRPTVKQSLPATSKPAEPPPSKPKKKKVGLFR